MSILIISLSSFLIFVVQPMISKFLLPTFGGAAAVWTTCLVFFQFSLCLGYAYAYLLTRIRRRAAAVRLHLAILILALTFLPFAPDLPASSVSPIRTLMGFLFGRVFVPYFVLATTTPLVHAWSLKSETQSEKFWLYAVSNFFSLAALIGYPTLIEPKLDGATQSVIWSGIFLVYCALTARFALRNLRAGLSSPPAASGLDRGDAHAGVWIGLAFVPSALLLAATNFICHELASIPLLWTVPLSLYLLTFIIAFSERVSPGYLANLSLLLFAALPACLELLLNPSEHASGLIFSALAGLFAASLLIHCELFRLRPPDSRSLPRYYLFISIGGALGGMFVGLAAPFILSNYFEYPALQVLSLATGFLILVRSRTLQGTATKDLAIVSLCSAAGIAVLAIGYYPAGVRFMRNFYGVLSIRAGTDASGHFRSLYHGNTVHGIEYLDGRLNGKPTAYYGPDSGAGRLLAADRGEKTRRIGIVGLGAGTLAAYGRPGDEIDYYEINPFVEQIARSDFNYLARSKALVNVELGDGRLKLFENARRSYDYLVIDAFSGDTIPVHLLTKEAFMLYLGMLKPSGVLALHISNRHIDLAPVVLGIADDLKKSAGIIFDSGDSQSGTLASYYGLVAASDAVFDELKIKAAFAPEPAKGRRIVWTDSFNNLFELMRF